MKVPGRVRIQGDQLLWSLGTDGWNKGAPASEALPAFLGLADADDTGFETFVRRFGPLGLGVGGSPLCFTGALPPITMDGNGQPWHVESIKMWRGLAHGAADLISLGRALRKARSPVTFDKIFGTGGRRDGLQDGARLLGRDGLVANLSDMLVPAGDDYGRRPRPLASQREWFARYLSSSWVRYGMLAPRVVWTGDEYRTELALGGDDLSLWPEGATFPVLALAIMSAITGLPTMRVCAWDGCGERLPEPDGPGRPVAYCPAHRLPAQQASKRESIRRKRAQARLQNVANGVAKPADETNKSDGTRLRNRSDPG